MMSETRRLNEQVRDLTMKWKAERLSAHEGREREAALNSKLETAVADLVSLQATVEVLQGVISDLRVQAAAKAVVTDQESRERKEALDALRHIVNNYGSPAAWDNARAVLTNITGGV